MTAETVAMALGGHRAGATWWRAHNASRNDAKKWLASLDAAGASDAA